MWKPTYQKTCWHPQPTSDELYHHGILGMSWGHRNGPPYPLDSKDHSAAERKAGWRKSLQNYYNLNKKTKAEIDYYRQNPLRREFRTVANEFNELYDTGLINNLKTAKAQNLNRWGQDPNTNILFITGMSGSGKSSISQVFAKHNNSEVVHLDSYFDNPKGPHSKDFDSYLRSKKSDYKRMCLPKDKISMSEWGKVVERFEHDLDRYGKDSYKKNKKIIVEGVQLLDDTMFPDKKYFRNKPVIILKGSILKNAKRANERDGKKFEFNDIKNRYDWNKDIKKFEKQNKFG